MPTSTANFNFSGRKGFALIWRKDDFVDWSLLTDKHRALIEKNVQIEKRKAIENYFGKSTNINDVKNR